MNDQSLYEEIGGGDTVDAVVSDFYDYVLADEQLVHFFEGMDMEALHAHQVQFISAVAGGPVEYTGDDMRETHAHLAIKDADFNAVAEYLGAALQENGIQER